MVDKRLRVGGAQRANDTFGRRRTAGEAVVAGGGAGLSALRHDMSSGSIKTTAANRIVTMVPYREQNTFPGPMSAAIDAAPSNVEVFVGNQLTAASRQSRASLHHAA